MKTYELGLETMFGTNSSFRKVKVNEQQLQKFRGDLTLGNEFINVGSIGFPSHSLVAYEAKEIEEPKQGEQIKCESNHKCDGCSPIGSHIYINVPSAVSRQQVEDMYKSLVQLGKLY